MNPGFKNNCIHNLYTSLFTDWPFSNNVYLNIRPKEDEQLPLEDPVIAEIAQSHGRTPVQV